MIPSRNKLTEEVKFVQKHHNSIMVLRNRNLLTFNARHWHQHWHYLVKVIVSHLCSLFFFESTFQLHNCCCFLLFLRAPSNCIVAGPDFMKSLNMRRLGCFGGIGGKGGEWGQEVTGLSGGEGTTDASLGRTSPSDSATGPDKESSSSSLSLPSKFLNLH